MDVGEEFGIYFKMGWGGWVRGWVRGRVGWFRNEEGNIILFSTYADIGHNWAN